MLLSLVALMLAGQAPSLDGVVGHWRTETRGGVVDIERCGGSICGRLISSEHLRTDPTLKDVKNRDASLRGRPLKNLLILNGFKADGDAWTGGTIYNADDGRTYNAKVTPTGPNQLTVRGCVFVPLCKTQTWTRVP